MKKNIFYVICFFCSSLLIFAQNYKIEDYISKENAEYLKANKTYSLVHEKNDNKITLVPNCFYSEQIKNNLICNNEKGVPFLAEFLYLIPKSELSEDISKVNIETIGIVFRSISKMEGMKYIHNGGKEDVLYKKAFAVASAESMEKVPDPVNGPTDGVVAYGYQHDNTFGDTKYKLNYYQKDNVIFSTFLNVIPMNKLGVKAVMPERLRINIVAVDLGDDLLLYLATDVCSKNIIGVRGQIEDSMTVRMDAIYKWFLQQFK